MADLTYSATYTMDTRDRMECDGFRGNFVSVAPWLRTDYTTSGNLSVTNAYNTVVITTPEVTVTWMNNAGGASYKFYVVLETEFGTYTSPTITQSWTMGDTKTLVFTLTDVRGDWTSFTIWGQNWTMAEKDTDYPYVYWFNNDNGVVTVEYTKTGDPPIQAYVGAPKITTITYPSGTITASSTSGTAVISRAFDQNTGTAWRSDNETSPEVLIRFNEPFNNFKIRFIPFSSSYAPADVTISGSNDNVNFTQLKRSSLSSSTSGTMVSCQNQEYYNTLKMTFKKNATYVEVAEIRIYGDKVPTEYEWKEATPYVYTSGAWVKAKSALYTTEWKY